MNKLLIIFALLVANFTFSQTKKELEDQLLAKQKSLDSLNAVLENMENIVENRDRSIKILRKEHEDLKEDIFKWDAKVKEKDAELIKMRKQISSGEAKMMTLNNSRATLKVAEGKYWTINQFMADYTSGISTDTSGNVMTEEIHVFVKSINGDILTDPDQQLYGPKLFSSLHPEHALTFPILLTSNTKFTIVVYKGTIGNLTLFEGNVYCSFTEKENMY